MKERAIFNINRPQAMRRAATYRRLRIPIALVIMSLFGSYKVPAQGLSAKALDELNRAGFGFYDLSAFSGYSTTTGPAFDPLTSTVLPNASFHTISSGISTSLGWRSRKSQTLHFDLRYSPSYYYVTSSSGYSRSRFSPTQNLGLNWDKKLGSKWTATFSLSGSIGDFDQLLLLPTSAQSLSLQPGTAAYLAAAGSGAFGLITPQQTLYYGARILTAAAQTSVTYAATPRLNVSFGAGSSRMQHLGGASTSIQGSGLIHQTTGLNGNFALAYALSPRSDFLTSVSYSRAISSLATTPWASVMLGFSRIITEQLVVHASVGAGYILPNAVQGTSLQRTQMQASAGVSYRAFRQTFIGMVSRNASDNFGLGASATVNASGGWTWSPPRGAWGFSAGVQDTWLQGVSLGGNGYSINANTYRSLLRRGHMSLGYGFGSYSSAAFLGQLNNIPLHYTSHSLRFSIGFSPYLGTPDGIRGSDPTR
jgi:hypothetical protein